MILFQLVLKHRQGKNHKMRIIVFVGSPIESDEKEVSKKRKKMLMNSLILICTPFGTLILCIFFSAGETCQKVEKRESQC